MIASHADKVQPGGSYRCQMVGTTRVTAPQEVQRELQQEKSERQSNRARAEELERIAEELRAAQAELSRKSQAMEDQANGLSIENQDLRRKVCTVLLECILHTVLNEAWLIHNLVFAHLICRSMSFRASTRRS